MHHDDFVRTTINIEDDLVDRLKEEAHRKRRPFTEIVNNAIRAGMPSMPSERKPYQTIPFESKLCPGIDPGKLNQLADELEDEFLIDRIRRFENS